MLYYNDNAILYFINKQMRVQKLKKLKLNSNTCLHKLEQSDMFKKHMKNNCFLVHVTWQSVLLKNNAKC